MKEEAMLARAAIYRGSFKGLTVAQSNKVRQRIVRSIVNRESYTPAVNSLQEMGMTDAQAKATVRTEEHEIRSRLREASFRASDPKGTHKFKWEGADDWRTTPCCRAIMMQTARGVSLDKLKEIIKRQAGIFYPKWTVRGWTPHPNCRHAPTRVFS